MRMAPKSNWCGWLYWSTETVEGTVVGKQAGSSLNLCFAIPANAPNPEAAYKFIQWAAGAEGQEILASGNMFQTIKRRDYQMNF